MADKYAVKCNLGIGTKIGREGALAYVGCGGGGMGYERVSVLLRSRGGRWVEKWEPLHRLTNFRAVAVPPESPMYGESTFHLFFFEARGGADEFAATLQRLSRKYATERTMPTRAAHGSR